MLTCEERVDKAYAYPWVVRDPDARDRDALDRDIIAVGVTEQAAWRNAAEKLHNTLWSFRQNKLDMEKISIQEAMDKS